MVQIPGYDDLTLIGRGGFSSVYRARQAAVDRDVAVKVLAVDLVDEAARARFRRECATNGRVGAHPGVVTVYDSGFTDDGHPFLSMQLCPGGSLGDALRHRGPLPVPEVLHAGVTIAAALAFAHSVGVLHRDIKPENILVGPFGEPLLADFGIATIDDQRVSTMTAASFTINHAAPECLAGAPPSASADLYELSSTLYTLLAGHPPFVAGASAALVALVSMVMNEPAPPLQRPDVPPSLNGLLLAGLAKGPEGRPPDATAFGRGLQAVQAELGLPVTAWPTPPAGAGAAAVGAAAATVPGSGTVPPAPAGGMPTGPGAMPPTVPGAAPFTAPGTGPAFTPAFSATGPGAPVLIPETIAPFAPSDPTRLGFPGAAPSSMTMVASTGPRPPAGGPPTVPGQPLQGPERPKRGRTIAIIAAVVVLLALAAGGVWWMRTDHGTTAEAAAVGAGTSTSDSDTATTSSDSETTTDDSSTDSADPGAESETEISESTSSKALLPGLSESDVGLTTDFGPTTATVPVPPVTLTSPAVSTTRVAPPTTVVKTVVVTSKPTTKTTTAKTTATTATGLTIDSFDVLGQNIVGGKVDCSAQPSHNDAPDSGVPILQLTWSAPKATTAWIGVDAGPDASMAPFESDLPPVMGGGNFEEVPFACWVAQHTYTLTVAGPGTKTSKTITLQRGPLPTAQPTS